MKLSDIKAAPGFEDLFPPMSVEKQDRFGANLIMFKFLSEIETVTKDRNITRKKLAELIGTSASYITQLFRGDKVINILTLAKLERALDIEFEITTAKREEKKTQIDTELGSYHITVNGIKLNSESTSVIKANIEGDGDNPKLVSSPYFMNFRPFSYQQKNDSSTTSKENQPV